MTNHRAELFKLAPLINKRNETERQITAITGRPASIGHLGEFIASKVFEIELSVAANQKSIDGFFSSGRLEGGSVNVKWYGAHEMLLDVCVDSPPDFYLVLSGPTKAAGQTDRTRPWLIRKVFLFDTAELMPAITARAIGIATSIRGSVWDSCEIYPRSNSKMLTITEQQRDLLSLFD